MEERFEINVTHEGKDIPVSRALMPYGYTYRMTTDINGTEVIYEPDEESGYRVIANDTAHKLSNTDKLLIKLIGEQLEALRD